MATNGIGDAKKDATMSREELHKIDEALGNEEFRKLFFDYVKELSENNNCEDAAKEAERRKGLSDVGLIRPEPNYVIKTTTFQGTENNNALTKSFINMCSSSSVGKPSCVRVTVGRAAESGIQWSIPHSVSSPRDDLDKQGEPCLVCDVIFHEDTLRFAKCNRQFRRLVEEVALDAFEKVFSEADNKTYKTKSTVDRRNLKYPKLPFKGQPRNVYLRSNNPQDTSSQSGDGSIPETNATNAQFMKLPFKGHGSCSRSNSALDTVADCHKDTGDVGKPASTASKTTGNCVKPASNTCPGTLKFTTADTCKEVCEVGELDLPTVPETVPETPKYTLKYRHYSDLQDFVVNTCIASCSGGHRPREMVVEIHLPRVEEAAGVKLDVKGRKLTVESVDGKTYRLQVDLPYDMKEDEGKARFDRNKKTLTVELPVVWNRLIPVEVETVMPEFPEFTYRQDDREIVFVLQVLDVSSGSLRFRNEGTQTHTLTFDAPSTTKDDAGSLVQYQIVWRFPQECLLHPVPRFNISKRNVLVAFEKVVVSSEECKRFEVGGALDQLRWEEVDSVTDVAKKIQCLQDENLMDRETCNVEVVELSESRLSVKVKSSLASTGDDGIQGSGITSASEADLASLSNAVRSIDLSDGYSSSQQYKMKVQLENRAAKNPRDSFNSGGSNRKVRSYSESSTDAQMSSCRSRYPKGILKYRRMGRSVSECADDLSWSSPEFFAGPDSDLPEESCEEGGHSLEKKSVRFSEIVSRNIFKSNLSILSQRSKNQQRLRNRRRASGKRSSESDCSENESGDSAATRAEKCAAENQKMKASKKRHAGKKSKGLDRYTGFQNGNKPNGSSANKKSSSCSASDGDSDLTETPPQSIDNLSRPIVSKRNSRWNKSQWKNSGRKRRNSGCDADTTNNAESAMTLPNEVANQDKLSGNIAFSNDLMFQLDD